MLVSRKLLEQYIDLTNVTDSEIAEKLTFAGIEVEGFSKLASASSLVIGEVISTTKIKDSDHLTACQVNVGSSVKTIVCGAPNVRTGLKVIVALEGAVLPAITIRATTIKGVASEGMICSTLELGVPKHLASVASLTGIEELNEDAPLGAHDVLAYLGLDDTLFDLKPLANRSDLLALYNVVRELAAVLNVPYKLPSYELSADFSTDIKLEVESPLVAQFALSEIRGVEVGPSPRWLVQILEKHGLRSVNNLVDIGNYVMLLTGRPLHLYDLDKVKDHHFIVKSDVATSFLALNEEDYNVQETDQLIVDQHNNVLCLGGVMGALACSVQDKTTRIALEVAHFDQATIRQTVTRLNIPSDAAIRFTKGINKYNTEEVFALAHHLIKEVNSKVTVSNIINVSHLAPLPLPITFDDAFINKLLGTNYGRALMISTLARVEIEVDATNNVKLPPYRNDIFSNADLAEEIIRLLGFAKIDVVLPTFITKAGTTSSLYRARNEVRTYLRHHNLYETLTYTLVSDKELTYFNLFNDGAALKLTHPMTPQRAYLRPFLLPSLLEAAAYNLSRQSNHFGMFEFSEITTTNGPSEHLALLLTGSEIQNGLLKVKPYDFYDIKGYFTGIMDLLGIKNIRYSLQPLPSDVHGFHPYQSSVILLGKETCGYFGLIHPSLAQKLDLNPNTYLLELKFSEFVALKVSPVKFNDIARFPLSSRDLAFVLDAHITSEDILRTIYKEGGKLLVDAQVFDLFTSPLLGAEKKSLAIRLSFQDKDKTLRDEDITPVLNNIIAALEKRYQAQIRG